MSEIIVKEAILSVREEDEIAPAAVAPLVASGKPRARADSVVARASSETMGIALLIEKAIESGRPVAELVQAFEKALEIQARQQFAQAMHQFRASMPAVPKARWANMEKRDGSGAWGFAYAPLDVIEEYARPVLDACGLSYRWVQEPPQGGIITTICIVRHVGGHEERTPYYSPIGDNKAISTAQNWAVANSFNKRQSLVAALGIVTTDYFDDEEALARAREANKGATAKQIRDEVQAPRRRPDAEPPRQAPARPPAAPPPAAPPGEFASDRQVESIKRRADYAGISEAEVCRRFELETFAKIPRGKVNAILAYLETLAG